MAGKRPSRTAVPTGTVDLIASTAPGAKAPANRPTALLRIEVSTDPSEADGVGRVTKTTRAPSTASLLRAWKVRRPVATPSAIREARSGS